jgi:DNA-binding YbaB/EbfC family protein
LVKVTLSGKGDLRRLSIDPKVVDPTDIEMLEDLIVAAHNAAKQALDASNADEMAKITGGLQLPPGLKLPF